MIATLSSNNNSGGRTGNRQARIGSVPALPPPGPARVPRVARLMALAIRFDGLVRCGQVEDFAQIARLGYVTRGRLSQIMDLANLPPDIQEELLFRCRQAGCTLEEVPFVFKDRTRGESKISLRDGFAALWVLGTLRCRK